MKDQFGREITYLRISVTDRCNLRCQYCMPNGVPDFKPKQILTFEEILKIVQASVSLGIVDFRITGGEPLVRKDISKLIHMMRKIPGVQRIAVTTNGVMLEQQAQALKEAGTDSINVSLDTTDPAAYQAITGSDLLGAVDRGIRAALKCRIPVKLNGVSMSCDYAVQLAEYGKELGVPVRLIEMMPIGYGKASPFIGNDEILAALELKYGKAEPVSGKIGDSTGPAVYYRFPDLNQPIGLISAMSHEFCESCNRVRLTADGKLKLCLCYDQTVDLKAVLEEQPDRLAQRIREAVEQKPRAHCFGDKDHITEQRRMSEIGG